MSGLATQPSISDTTKVETDPFEESFRTTALTCSISAAVAYFCIAGIICGMGMTGVKTHIHWNACVALIISNVLLLVGSERKPESTECKAVSIATQFFNLASQTWTTIEVIHLFRLSSAARPHHMNTGSDISERDLSGKLDRAAATGVDHNDDAQSFSVDVNQTPSATDRKAIPSSNAKSSHVLCYYVIGWILPCVFVAATVLPALDSYGKSYKCWIMTDSEIIWLFVAPTVALFIFHCVATCVTINNSKHRTTTGLNNLNTGQSRLESQAARESETTDEGPEQGTIFVHPPIYVVSEKRLTLRLPADEETNKNLSLITHWNFSVLPLISFTWCLWISALTLRVVVLLYIICAVSAGQVIYLFTYYCVITFRLERKKRVLRKNRMNEDARPVTILFGDDDGDTKTAAKHKKFQNMELMLRTPTPFPNREPSMQRYILPPSEVGDHEQENELARYAASPALFHDGAEWNDNTSIDNVTPRESERKTDKTKDNSFSRKFNNRLKLEAFVNVDARLVIDESSRSPSCGSYTFEYNRPISRSQGILARHSTRSQDYDLSARADAEKLSQSLVCSTLDEYSRSDAQELHTRLPFAS